MTIDLAMNKSETLSKFHKVCRSRYFSLGFLWRGWTPFMEIASHSIPTKTNSTWLVADLKEARNYLFGNNQSLRPKTLGLRLLMRVQQHEYYPCTQTAGFKVYMHPADEYPFVETYGYNIAPGLLTSMAITMVSPNLPAWPRTFVERTF